MKEGTVEYSVKLQQVGKKENPEYSVEYVVKLRPYNEVSLDDIDFAMDLIDSGLIAVLQEDTKRKLLRDPNQFSAKSEARQNLPEFCEEKPVTQESLLQGESLEEKGDFAKKD